MVIKKVCFKLTKSSAFLLLVLFSSLLSAQTGSVKGFVYDKANGEPIPFCNVFFKGTTIGANTDLNGFFTINRVPPGDYNILVTSLDFDTISEKISIVAGEILNKKFFAKKGGVKLDEVEVSTTAAEKIENTTVAVTKIDPIAISKLPSIGEPDIAQYLQVLPGVVFTGDQGGQLYTSKKPTYSPPSAAAVTGGGRPARSGGSDTPSKTTRPLIDASAVRAIARSRTSPEVRLTR
jgi:hypothetical protein